MRYPIVFWDSGGTIFGSASGERPPEVPTSKQVRESRVQRVSLALEMFGHRAPSDLGRVLQDASSELQEKLGARYSLERLASGVYERLGLPVRPEETILVADAIGGPRYRTWLWDGVADALKALAEAGVRMGVIADTDWTGRMMSRALAGVGLREYFGPVICSCDVGVCKPAPEIYAAARALIPDVPSGSPVLYVGDNLEKDVGGAIAFGWDAAYHVTTKGGSSGRAVLDFVQYQDLVTLVAG
ncbi:MAG TPA: HAD family hydrolase [Candidatus Latescibacteria bacterium]|nr:HAD family hydrolase [Candidatus Latescibacterota bacterium]HOS63483.1 HAD family hydrolase [Candidatus Latescibacterota bacterium]HPK73232.1 HAD family hydrolase [Candidatus Latescibacterota bacterium]